MQAILSDLHGNLEAAEAVIADARRQGASEIICLGDLVGYGADPVGCLLISMDWSDVLAGDHDLDVLMPDDEFAAEEQVVPSRVPCRAENRQKLLTHRMSHSLLEYLAARPARLQRGDVLYVHGSPRNPTQEYLFPEDVHNGRKMARNGELFEELVFCGHTGIAGLFIQQASDWRFVPSAEVAGPFNCRRQRVICNVGSVGRPRDGDPRPGYVLFDGPTVRFRRVETPRQ